jgi:hypothetical protein
VPSKNLQRSERRKNGKQLAKVKAASAAAEMPVEVT